MLLLSGMLTSTVQHYSSSTPVTYLQNLRSHVTSATTKNTGHVRTEPENMRVEFEVSSLNHCEAIGV